LVPIPIPALTPTCNCVKFVKNLGIRNNIIDEPIVAGSVRTNEGNVGHRAFILKIEMDSIVIVESNYVPCQITFRRLYLDDPIITGYTD